jgi:hypothetical protein
MLLPFDGATGQHCTCYIRPAEVEWHGPCRVWRRFLLVFFTSKNYQAAFDDISMLNSYKPFNQRSRSGESDDVESYNTQQVPDTIASFEPSMQKRSLSSIRAGVTVAMVAVALGLTCCENILHIFVYNRTSLQSEITTLIAKSLFPVHPLAAAIQSIYVCRRDLEKDSSIGLGRVVLPSVLFHGTYDFALLLISDSWKRSQASQYFYSGDYHSHETIITLCISVAIILSGWLFYVVQSRRQYARLIQLSSRVCEVQMS